MKKQDTNTSHFVAQFNYILIQKPVDEEMSYQ